MAERAGPQIYSIAAHRGFADALVAGLVPRYAEPDVGLARLTLLLPSTRAQRIITEAFIRHAGETGSNGLLMPRMAVVGDLDLDETLGSLLDPLGAAQIPRAVDPVRRWLALASLLADELGEEAPKGATLFRLARETAGTMDKLLVEGIGPEELLQERVLQAVASQANHWQASIRTFARVQARWLAWLESEGALDAAARRNRLFAHARRRWQAEPPATPIVAAGVTSAAPELAKLLRVVSELPGGAVILPDLDLGMPENVWDELGRAGSAPGPDGEVCTRDDAVTHPQYHLKLLLNRMGVARGEVRQWHRKGLAASEPARTHAISNLFLPPEASKTWADLEADKRRLKGVTIMESANPEEEAQAIALLVREALETPEKRVSVVTPDRGLARRVVQHLARWNILADDSAGRPLSDTAAGRLLLLLAELASSGFAPVPLMALAMHPLVDGGMDRREWLRLSRLLERELRGPRPKEGLEPLDRHIGDLAKDTPAIGDWWSSYRAALVPLGSAEETKPLADLLDRLVACAEALCGDRIWAREDGRSLARFVEELRLNAREAEAAVPAADIDAILRDAMAEVAVRPPYGGHPRVAIYGLLESRMSRSDLVICGGLNEGVWPPRGSVDALLAPPVLRALGVPGADFRVGLSAHDLAGALGAPEVVLSRAARDEGGPAIPSRFLLRVQALLGEMADRHTDQRPVEMARAMARPAARAPDYPRPKPMPSAEQRDVPLAVTALDRLRGDPYQFYASSILHLRGLDALDAAPSPAWQGEVAHAILERWHEARKNDPAATIAPIMDAVMAEKNAHPLMRGLWEPRLLAALRWIEDEIGSYDARKVVAWEQWGEMHVDGVRVHGRVDRIDSLEGGGLAIVDYKTGSPPSASMVSEGFALQLGILGLIAEEGGFKQVSGDAQVFEYWSLGSTKDDSNPHGFGYVTSPIKLTSRQSGVELEEFLPLTRRFLEQAIGAWITGNEAFTAKLTPDYEGYSDYDQLMRLEEWLPRLADEEEGDIP